METFDAPIIEADRGGTYVRVPQDVVVSLGGAGRIPVQATFDGIAYRGSIVSMGGYQVLGVVKTIRTELRKAPGDVVTVTVEPDRGKRSVEVPDDLRDALARAGVSETFAALSYSHQREYVVWIEDAKRPDTRARRISETVRRVGA